jgi:hypothetical protein
VQKQIYNTSTGTTGRNFGDFWTDDIGFLLNAAKANPDNAAMILRLAQGQTGRPLGRFAAARDNLRGNAFQAALALAGAGDFGNLEDMAGDFLNQGIYGNDLLGYTGGLGQQVAGMDFTGMDSDLMESILKAGLALQGNNMGGFGKAQRQGQLDDVIWQDIVRNFANPNNDEKNFADLLTNSPYQRAMAAFR